MGGDADAERLRKGDPGALAPLLERYGARLLRYLLRLTGDGGLAEDLFQQTWIRVVDRIGRWDPGREFGPWLFAVARNLAFDERRRPAPVRLDPDEEAALAAPGAGEAALLERLSAHERARRVAAALADLGPADREVLGLRFEEEMTLPAISEVMGCPLPTAKARLYRALARLGEALRRRWPGEDWQ